MKKIFTTRFIMVLLLAMMSINLIGVLIVEGQEGVSDHMLTQFFVVFVGNLVMESVEKIKANSKRVWGLGPSPLL